MLDISLFILFCVMAFRITRGLQRESQVIKEFGQSKNLVYIVLLFPLGPLALTFGNLWLGPILSYLLALACYVPALLVSRSQNGALEKSGTDRVQRAQSVISQAFGMALLGIAYVGIAICIFISVTFIA